jgi:protein-tyrosine phosphatase
MKILMVCLGNICRSPIAEGILKNKLIENGIQADVDSAGVLSYHSGETPDRRAVEISKQFNIDISDQHARQFRNSDFEEFDLIFTMDKPVHTEITRRATNSEQLKKVKLFLEFSGFAGNCEVPDPYYGGKDGFEKVFRLIDEACEKLIDKLPNKK